MRSLLRGLLLCASALALCGCAVTVPVAVIASDGETLRGQATAQEFGNSTFIVSNDRVSCTGSFNGTTPTRTVSFATHCSDGRSGLGTAWRDTALSGNGTILLNDGTTAKFIFGPSAAGF
jgi:hypothetical protein